MIQRPARLRVFRLGAFLLLAAGAAACEPGSAQTSHGEEDFMSLSAEEAVAAFFASDPELTGAPADLEHARTLADSLPPDLMRSPLPKVRSQIIDTWGADNADSAFLYGGMDALTGERECELLAYQGMLSGGMTACVIDGTVVAVWLTPEG